MNLFAFEANPLELFIRATVIWWFIFLMLRFVMRRDLGEVRAADILLLVLIADAAQNGLANEYKSLSEGLFMISSLFFWNWLLDILGSRFKWAEVLTNPAPIRLIRNGRYVHNNLKKLKLNVKDVEAEVRKSSIDDVQNVKDAWFESDGTVSIVPKSK